MYDPGQNFGEESLDRAPGCLLWVVALLWVIANVAGAWLGELLRESVVSLFIPGAMDIPGALSIEGHIPATETVQILPELAGGLAAGIVLALAQDLVLFPFLKRAGIIEWSIATIIGWTVGWLAIYIGATEMVRLVISKQGVGVCVFFAMLVGLGIISGLALGYAQGIVWRRRINHPSWWVLASIPGPVAVAILVMLALYIETENTVRSGTTIIAAFVSGACTSVALMNLLRYPKPEAEWADMFKGRKPLSALPEEEVSDTILGSSLYERRTPLHPPTSQSDNKSGM